MDLRRLTGFDDLLERSVRMRRDQILIHRAREKNGFLRHHPEFRRSSLAAR